MGSPHLYRLNGRDLGLPDAVLDAVLAQSAMLHARGVAPVVSLGHLAHSTGAPYSYLRSVVERTIDPYHSFEIRRRDGRTPRLISSPAPTLMDVQRWILRRILSRVPTHVASYAYEKGKSIRDCATQHLGSQWLIKLDLHNFFHSIDERRVFEVFAGLGYARLLDLEMARICTRQATFNGFPHPTRFRVTRRRNTVIPMYSTDLLGFLPQGAPTSGVLANLVARQMDEKLEALAALHQLVYTRYADDIVFSGLGPFSRATARHVILRARTAVEQSGFALHAKKTHVVPPGARRIVLGLLVDGDRVRLSKEMRERIANHVYGVEKFGLSDHQLTRGFTSALGLARYIDGLLSFAHDVDPQWTATFRARWRQSLLRDASMLLPQATGDVFLRRQPG